MIESDKEALIITGCISLFVLVALLLTAWFLFSAPNVGILGCGHE